MSQGKQSTSSLMNTLRQQKVTRSGREPRPSTRYPPPSGEGGRGRGGGGGRGRGGGGGRGRGGGGAPFFLEEEIPSASGDVASQSARSESPDAEVEMEGTMDEETERAMAPKKMRTRGEARVPDVAAEPTTEEGKALLKPGKKE